MSDGLPYPQRAWAMLVIILGITITVLDSTVVTMALPSIGRQLQASATRTIWVVNAYQIATLVMVLPLATLGDRIGYRRVYLVGMTVFVLGSLMSALTRSLEMLIAARALVGIGSAGMFSVNIALVRLTYPADLLGRGIAINSVVVATALVAGPAVAALILSFGSWPWLFAANVPLSLLTLALAARALPRNVTTTRRFHFSLLDMLLNTAMFALLFLGASALGEDGVATLSPSAGWLLLLAGLAVAVLHVQRQRKLAVPLLPVDLLRIPVFALSMGTSISSFCAQMLAYIALPFLFLDSYGRTHATAGLLMTAWPLGIVLVAPLVGRLIGRVPAGLLGGAGLGLMALGLLLLALLPAQPSNADIVWRTVLCGLGFGMFQSPNNHTIVTSAPPQRSGAAGGMLSTARLTGQTIGAVMMAAIFSVWSPHDGKGPTIALLLAAVWSVLGAVFSTLRVRQ
ncbi:MAG: MFS transporter [Burkholderiaceae bacterium]|jgi:DHA2 family multidrug resistance protein-like MFS transporter|nr:MFS transporter [Burkholderiaceae bacterium]